MIDSSQETEIENIISRCLSIETDNQIFDDDWFQIITKRLESTSREHLIKKFISKLQSMQNQIKTEKYLSRDLINFIKEIYHSEQYGEGT